MKNRNNGNMIDNPPIDSDVVRPTFSTVDGVPSRQGSPLIQHGTDETINELIQVSSCQSMDDEDTKSTTSADSITPLLERDESFVHS